jgi:hypothetical protein
VIGARAVRREKRIWEKRRYEKRRCDVQCLLSREKNVAEFHGKRFAIGPVET